MHTLAVVIMFTMVFPSLSFAVDLNAPAEKKITIGSEIERGVYAINEITLSIKATDLLGRLQAISNVFERNKQANVDTQAFRLGAGLAAWLSLDIILNIAAQNPNSIFFPPKEVQLAKDTAMLYFKEARKTQKEFNMDDKTLAQAVHLSYDLLKTKIYRWERQ